MPEIFKDAADLERKFNQQGFVVRRQILAKAVKAGAEVIRDKAEQLAPRDTGQLAETENIRVIGAESTAAEVVARIGPAKSSFYGLFQEKGTAFHPAQPFLNPALEQSRQDAFNASLEASRKELNKLG